MSGEPNPTQPPTAPAASAATATAATTAAADEKKAAVRTAAKEMLARFIEQLTKGCGRTNCDNKECASAVGAKVRTPAEAMKRAIELLRLPPDQQRLVTCPSRVQPSFTPQSVPAPTPPAVPSSFSLSSHSPSPSPSTPPPASTAAAPAPATTTTPLTLAPATPAHAPATATATATTATTTTAASIPAAAATTNTSSSATPIGSPAPVAAVVAKPASGGAVVVPPPAVLGMSYAEWCGILDAAAATKDYSAAIQIIDATFGDAASITNCLLLRDGVSAIKEEAAFPSAAKLAAIASASATATATAATGTGVFGTPLKSQTAASGTAAAGTAATASAAASKLPEPTATATASAITPSTPAPAPTATATPAAAATVSTEPVPIASSSNLTPSKPASGGAVPIASSTPASGSAVDSKKDVKSNTPATPSHAAFYSAVTPLTVDELCPLDWRALDVIYSRILLGGDKLRTALVSATRRLCSSLERSVSSLKPLTPLELRKYAVLLESPLWNDAEYHEIFSSLCKTLSKLHVNTKKLFVKWMAQYYDTPRIEKHVAELQQYITVRWYTATRIADVTVCVSVLEMLYQANEQHAKSYEPDKPVVPYTSWYNEAVNGELNLREDYRRWRQRAPFSFSLYPFLLEPINKSRLMQIDAAHQQHQSFEDAIFQSMMQPMQQRANPYLLLKIKREQLVQDTLGALQRKDSLELKKPLKIQFVGEHGVDEGGVQKEWFQLIVAAIFDAKFGMFSYKEKSRYFWFRSSSTEMGEFELIGIILGLAIYNSVILDVRFPLVVYKKLLGQKPTLDDLCHLKPSLGRGLKQLLTFEGDVENTYMRSFAATYKQLGVTKTVELKKGGADIPLTNANRKEYVDLYVDFIMTKAIHKQYRAFEDGFLSVAGGDALKLFRPEELELLIAGESKFDFNALQEATVYEDGYNKNSRVIKDFWSVVHEFSVEEKKKFLFFCTGSDRVPIKGLGNLEFVIGRCADSDRLPSAHTCFNHLLLPDYVTREKLKKYLLMALANNKGFGLM